MLRSESNICVIVYVAILAWLGVVFATRVRAASIGVAHSRKSMCYDEHGECLCIHAVHAGIEDSAIKLRLGTLKDRGPDAAAKWVGETILLLVPSLRTEVFDLPPAQIR
jgi:hypothetical protein